MLPLCLLCLTASKLLFFVPLPNLNPLPFTAPFISLWYLFSQKPPRCFETTIVYIFSFNSRGVCVPLFFFPSPPCKTSIQITEPTSFPLPWAYWKGKYHIYQRFLTFQICTSNCNGGGDILSLKNAFFKLHSFVSFLASHIAISGKIFMQNPKISFPWTRYNCRLGKDLPVFLHYFDPCCSSLQLTLTSFLIS